MAALDRKRLDNLYRQWNRPEYVTPDPLETVLPYPDPADREMAGLVAASLAYGRVNTILPSVRRVLAVLGESPRSYAVGRTEAAMTEDLSGIVHRFARPSHIAALLAGAGTVVREKGCLEEGFLTGFREVEQAPFGDPEADSRRAGSTIAAGRRSHRYPPRGGSAGKAPALAGMIRLTRAIRDGAHGDPGHLLPHPEKGSACKRLFLWLRWMVRRDAVDPGGWDRVDPASLVVPLDTWLHRIALRAGWTERRSPDLKTALDVTAALREIRPDDPCRYDFALTRFGIRSELDLEFLFAPRGG